jgi:hypothetical protein
VVCVADGRAEGDVQAVVAGPGITPGAPDELAPAVVAEVPLAPAPLGLLAGPTRAVLMAW